MIKRLLLLLFWAFSAVAVCAQSYAEDLYLKRVHFPYEYFADESSLDELTVKATDLEPDVWYALLEEQSGLFLHDAAARWKGLELCANRYLTFGEGMITVACPAPALLVRLKPAWGKDTYTLQMGTGRWLEVKDGGLNLSFASYNATPLAIQPVEGESRACRLVLANAPLVAQNGGLTWPGKAEASSAWRFLRVETEECSQSAFKGWLMYYLCCAYWPTAEELEKKEVLTDQELQFATIFWDAMLEVPRTEEEYEQLRKSLWNSYYAAFVETPSGDYAPFLQEGKRWKMARYPNTYVFEGKGDPTYFDVRIEGDTLIEGKACKFFVEGCGDYLRKRPIYEADGKVYAYEQDEFRLLYDFACKEGDVLNLYAFGMEFSCLVEKIERVVTSGGQSLRRYWVREFTDDESLGRMWDGLPMLWLEGVGSCIFPDQAIGYMGMTGNTTSFEECWLGDQLLATSKDFSIGTGIATPTAPVAKPKVPATRYTLDGRLIQGTPRGLHIMRQADGRSRLEWAR